MQSNFTKTLALGLVGIGLAAAPVFAQNPHNNMVMPSGSAVQSTPSQSEQSAGSNNAASATPSSSNPRGNAKPSMSRGAAHGSSMGSMAGSRARHSGKMTGHSGMHSSSRSSADHSADQLNSESLAAMQKGQQYVPGASHSPNMPASSGKRGM